MYYITVKQSPSYRQMSLEELLFDDNPKSIMINPGGTNTRTVEVGEISEKVKRIVPVKSIISEIDCFNRKYDKLFSADRKSLYDEFYIPKKSGGLRRIDAPNAELKRALYDLKEIFENRLHSEYLYHTSAYAYVRGRSTKMALEKHQANKSRWFEKLDLHDFFGSTTKEFVMDMFSMIYPFSEIMNYDEGRGREVFEKALDLAFLNGGLPQGTPLSPLITNIMMIPIDFNISKRLRDDKTNRFVYTRYADDFQISSKYDFDFRSIESLVKDVLEQFHSPFKLNDKKTRYGSSAGSNWNLGLMLNKDNEITVGYKKKKHLQSMIFNYIKDKKNGVLWDTHDVQVMSGLIQYYTHIEKDCIVGIINHIDKKHSVNVLDMIKEDLK